MLISEAYRLQYGVGLSVRWSQPLMNVARFPQVFNVEPMLSLKASTDYNYACDIVLYTTILNDYDELPSDFSRFKRTADCAVVR